MLHYLQHLQVIVAFIPGEVVQVAAEGEELFVVSYPAVDGGGEEPHFQLVVHYAADACVGDE